MARRVLVGESESPLILLDLLVDARGRLDANRSVAVAFSLWCRAKERGFPVVAASLCISEQLRFLGQNEGAVRSGDQAAALHQLSEVDFPFLEEIDVLFRPAEGDGNIFGRCNVFAGEHRN